MTRHRSRALLARVAFATTISIAATSCGPVGVVDEPINVGLASFTSGPVQREEATGSATASIETGVVVAVPGGDRLVVEAEDGQRFRIRTAGALAPTRPMCGFRSARRFTRGLMPVGTLVSIEADTRLGTDARLRRYDVRYVGSETGPRDLGLELLRRGWALYSPIVAYETGVQREQAYLRVEKRAFRLKRGIWGMCL